MKSEVHTKTKKRFNLFKILVDERRPGEQMTTEIIVNELKVIEKEGGSPTRWDRILQTMVWLYNKQPKNNKICDLEYSRGKVFLLEEESNQFEERQNKANPQKRLISKWLLFWLFDQGITENSPTEEEKNRKEKGTPKPNFKNLEDNGFETNWSVGDLIHQRLERKRAILRSRTVISLLVDAGTTNLRLMTSLLSNKVDLPLRVKVGSSFRWTSLSLTTNSIPIAALAAEHTDRKNLTLRVIGGIENPKRRSISGELALIWARSIRERGAIDLSIIGTTGIKQSESGLLGAYMDDEMECQLKGEFLDLANFRILICDASKILMGSCTNLFTAITKECVDMIVIDDGLNLKEDDSSPFYSSPESVDATINEFKNLAANYGVGVVIVKQKPSEDQ